MKHVNLAETATGLKVKLIDVYFHLSVFYACLLLFKLAMHFMFLFCKFCWPRILARRFLREVSWPLG